MGEFSSHKRLLYFSSYISQLLLVSNSILTIGLITMFPVYLCQISIKVNLDEKMPPPNISSNEMILQITYFSLKTKTKISSLVYQNHYA